MQKLYGIRDVATGEFLSVYPHDEGVLSFTQHHDSNDELEFHTWIVRDKSVAVEALQVLRRLCNIETSLGEEKVRDMTITFCVLPAELEVAEFC